MMKKQLVIGLMFTLLCGCSSDQPLSVIDTREKVSILFGTANVDAVITRATPFLPQNEVVGISAYPVVSGAEATIATISKKYKVSDAVGALSSTDSKLMFLFSGQTYKFYAYSPLPDPDIAVTVKAVTLKNGADFKCSVAATATAVSGLTVTLPTLTRLCSNVGFVIERDLSYTALTNLGIGSDGVKIENLTNDCLYTLGSTAINVSTAARTSSCNVLKAQFTTLFDTRKYEAITAVLPKLQDNMKLTFDITFNGISKKAIATVGNMALAPNCYYKFSLVILDGKGKLFVQAWNLSTSDYFMGQGSGAIEVGSWTITTDATDMGTPTTYLTIGSWIPSITWDADMGQGAGAIGVGSWGMIEDNTDFGG